MKKISVVVPTFNRNGIVQKAINTAIDQTFPALEILVIDDGSVDGTSRSLQAFGSNIHYIYQRNAGVSAARNTGIQMAKGDWIAFLDSDDEWELNKLEKQIDEVNRDSSLVAIAANGRVFRSDEYASTDFFSTRHRTASLVSGIKVVRPLEWALDTIIMTPGMMVRRDVLMRAGLFDTSLRMFEDLDLWCRVAQLGAWWIDPTPLFRVYRRGAVGENLSDQSAAIRGHASRSLLYVYEKILQLKGFEYHEYRHIRRLLSATRADLASLNWDSMSILMAARNFGRSFSDYPSPTSAFRAAAGMVAGSRGVTWLRSLKRNEKLPEIRR